MTLSWTALILLCVAGMAFWFWQDSLAAREIANEAAIKACDRLALQFLDGTVAFARLRLARGRSGHLVLRRTYVFDYTANSIERRQGFVIISEGVIETIGYAQEGRPAEEPTEQRSTAESGQVLHLADWRKKTLPEGETHLARPEHPAEETPESRKSPAE